jgi:hypothetical protein
LAAAYAHPGGLRRPHANGQDVAASEKMDLNQRDVSF